MGDGAYFDWIRRIAKDRRVLAPGRAILDGGMPAWFCFVMETVPSIGSKTRAHVSAERVRRGQSPYGAWMGWSPGFAELRPDTTKLPDWARLVGRARARNAGRHAHHRCRERIMVLETRNAVVYGGGGSIGGAWPELRP